MVLLGSDDSEQLNYELKKRVSPYSRNFDGKMGVLRAENGYFWYVYYVDNSVS